MEADRDLVHAQALGRWWTRRTEWIAGKHPRDGFFVPPAAIDNCFPPTGRSHCTRHAIDLIGRAKAGEIENVHLTLYRHTGSGPLETLVDGASNWPHSTVPIASSWAAVRLRCGFERCIVDDECSSTRIDGMSLVRSYPRKEVVLAAALANVDPADGLDRQSVPAVAGLGLHRAAITHSQDLAGMLLAPKPIHDQPVELLTVSQAGVAHWSALTHSFVLGRKYHPQRRRRLGFGIRRRKLLSDKGSGGDE